MEFEGIVIRRTQYKGDDVMINVLTKDKIRSFLAKGVLKITSKNSSSVNLFTKSKFQVFKGKDGDFLRVGEVLSSYPNLNSDLEKLALLDFISEITNNFIESSDSENIYPFLEKTLESINNGFSPWMASLIYFAKILKTSGYSLLDQDIYKVDDRKSKIIEYIFKVDVNNFNKVSLEKDECKNIMIGLINFLNFTSQIDIKSIKLLENL